MYTSNIILLLFCISYLQKLPSPEGIYKNKYKFCLHLKNAKIPFD